MSLPQRINIKKGNLTLYVILLVVAIVMMYILRSYGKVEKTIVKDTNEVEVAIEYSPMFLYTYNDTLGGFSYDLLRLVAKRSGVKVKFQPMVTLSTTLEKLKKGEYKIVCAEFPVTKEHKQNYLFTNPIYLDRQVLVQRKNERGETKVISQLDLAQDTVWVVNGSSAELRIRNLSNEIGDTIYVKTENSYGAEQLLLRVASGEIKQAVMNERVAAELAKKYNNIDISTGISLTQFQSWILNKEDSVLCDSINVWLEQVKNTPEYRSIYFRYFSE